MSNAGYTLEALIKAGQEQAMEEKRQEAPGEETDEEMEKKEKEKKSKEAPSDSDETKTAAVRQLADALEATGEYVVKVGADTSIEPAPLQEGGQVPVQTPPTGEQPHPQPNPPADRDPAAEKTLGQGGTVGNTEHLPLAGQTQQEPGNSTAMDTGKTSSGTTKSQPVAAEQAKVSSLDGSSIRQFLKSAAMPEDTQSFPAGEPAGADSTASGGEVGYTAPTETMPQVSGDAATTRTTAQEAENVTQKPDLNPLLQTQPENHSASGDGAPNVDSKLGAYIRQRLQGGA